MGSLPQRSEALSESEVAQIHCRRRLLRAQVQEARSSGRVGFAVFLEMKQQSFTRSLQVREEEARRAHRMVECARAAEHKRRLSEQRASAEQKRREKAGEREEQKRRSLLDRQAERERLAEERDARLERVAERRRQIVGQEMERHGQRLRYVDERHQLARENELAHKAHVQIRRHADFERSAPSSSVLLPPDGSIGRGIDVLTDELDRERRREVVEHLEQREARRNAHHEHVIATKRRAEAERVRRGCELQERAMRKVLVGLDAREAELNARLAERNERLENFLSSPVKLHRPMVPGPLSTAAKRRDVSAGLERSPLRPSSTQPGLRTLGERKTAVPSLRLGEGAFRPLPMVTYRPGTSHAYGGTNNSEPSTIINRLDGRVTADVDGSQWPWPARAGERLVLAAPKRDTPPNAGVELRLRMSHAHTLQSLTPSASMPVL